MGAMNVALCFSAANNRIASMSNEVRNISINRPCAIEVPPPRVVLTLLYRQPVAARLSSMCRSGQPGIKARPSTERMQESRTGYQA